MSKLLVERAVVQQALEAMLNFPDDISEEMFESITALKAALAESERDWSMLEATQESLREHMAEIHRLRAALAELVPVDRCANCLRPKGEHQGDMCPRPYTTVWSAWDYEAKRAEPAQEPVAGAVLNADGRPVLVRNGMEDWYCKERNARRLYAAPPQQPEPAQEPGQEPVAQAMQDAAVYGVGISRDGKRIDPASIYAQPAQEPVAWSFEARHIDSAWAAAVTLKHPGPEGVYMRNVMPLYTTPPQRPPLTDEEMLGIIDAELEGGSLLDVARAVERRVRGE